MLQQELQQQEQQRTLNNSSNPASSGKGIEEKSAQIGRCTKPEIRRACRRTKVTGQSVAAAAAMTAAAATETAAAFEQLGLVVRCNACYTGGGGFQVRKTNRSGVAVCFLAAAAAAACGGAHRVHTA